MDFRHSKMQQDMVEQVQRLLADQFPSTVVRKTEASTDGFPRLLWEAVAARGWSGLLVSNEFGGQGLGLLDMCVLVEETGRAAATVPLVVSSGVVATVLHHSPPGSQRDRLLKAIASGAIISPALIDEDSRNEWDAPRLDIVQAGDGFALSGTKVLVPFASVADELLATATTSDGQVAIVAVDPTTDGVTITRHQSKVGVPLASVTFAQAQVTADRLIQVGGDAQGAIELGLQTGSLLSTAEAVGMSDALVAMTAQYVTNRQAFGRPIGTFQAVAHPCADMRVSVDAIRILVQQAAWLLDNGQNAGEEVPATKGLANEHFERVANDAYRLHGALGFSTECDVQLFTRRLQGFFGSFGETQESFERAAAALGM